MPSAMEPRVSERPAAPVAKATTIRAVSPRIRVRSVPGPPAGRVRLRVSQFGLTGLPA